MKPPTKPRKPVKPAAPIESYETPYPPITIEMSSSEELSLDEIINGVKTRLPDGEIFNLSNLSFNISCYSDYYGHGDAKFIYTVNRKVVTVNKNFKQDQRNYLARMEKYEVAMKEYNQKSYEYDIAMKQYQDCLKSEEIRKAKEVLAANGVTF